MSILACGKNSYYSFFGKHHKCLEIYDIETAEIITTFEDIDVDPELYLEKLSFSFDNSLLACLYNSRDYSVILIFDVNTVKCLYKFEINERVRIISFNHNQELLSYSFGHDIKIWDLSTGICSKTFEDKDGLGTLTYSKSGKTILSSSFNYGIKLRDATTGELLFCIRDLTINYTEFSHDEKLIISSFEDGRLKIWDIESNTCVHEIKTKFNRSIHKIHSFVFRDNFIVLGSKENKLKVWHTDTDQDTLVMKDDTEVYDVITDDCFDLPLDISEDTAFCFSNPVISGSYI